MPYLENALDLLRPAGPSKPLASCLRSLAIAHYFTHDFAGARPLLRQSEAVAKAVGDLRGAAAVQLAAAELAFAEGSTDEAIDITNAMLSGGKCNRRQKVLGLTNLAAYLLAADRIEDARLIARNALHEAIALDWRAAIVRLVEHLALVAALTEQTTTAARMLGYSVAFYETGAGSREHTELATYDRLLGPRVFGRAAARPAAAHGRGCGVGRGTGRAERLRGRGRRGLKASIGCRHRTGSRSRPPLGAERAVRSIDG